MKAWSDVAFKFIEFLKTPSGAGTAIIIALIMAVAYVYPIHILTKDISGTIRETSSQQIVAINKIIDILKEKRIVDKGE